VLYGGAGFALTMALFLTTFIVLVPVRKIGREKQRSRTTLAALNETWDDLLAEWHASGASAIIDRYESTKKDIARYKGLSTLEFDELQKLQRNHREISLDLHLAKYIIRDGQLGLPKRAIESLEAYGIQTAADIKTLDKIKIPKIGEARLRTLRDWRDSHVAKFIYNPTQKLPAWMTDDVKSRFDQQRRELEAAIPQHLTRLQFMLERWDECKDAKEGAIHEQARRIIDERSTLAMWDALSIV
jgi:DNA-binding helix-hairpin-helix protein with protein kinase domain